MSKEMKLIPELRFPEFISNGSWKASKIGSFAKVSAGGTPSSNEPKYWGGEIPWMNSGELNLKRVYDVENRITELGLKESSTKKIPSLCILIGLAGQGKTRGTAAINYIELCTNQSIAAIHPNKSKFDSEFLFQKVDSLYQKLRRLSTGQGGRGGLNLSIIREIKIPLPSLEEQQKIASCLSSLDELIAAHNDKLDALKAHKKGLLQNLFPQEGDVSTGSAVPKVRFPEFNGDGEWLECQLQKHCLSISSGKDKNQDDGEFDLYGSTGIIGKTENLSYEGDYILVARVGANAGLLNRAIGQFGVTDNTLVINLKEPRMVDFFFYSLEKIGLNKLVFGSGQPLVTGKQLKELNIPIPKNPKEQHKIATCLSAVDELISAQKEKIEELQQHKKGLMQGLFPPSTSLRHQASAKSVETIER
jgi:type I restriction enzyme S subunit